MAYEVKTPLLIKSVDVLLDVISGLEDGSVEGVTAGRLISAARGLQSAVANDIKVRLAAPRIAAFEARLVENEQRSTDAKLVEDKQRSTEAKIENRTTKNRA